MADKKVTALTIQASVAAEDLLLIIDDPNGTPASRKITVKGFFATVPANTVFSANVTVRGNRLLSAANTQLTKYLTTNNVIATLKSTPSTNNATTEGWSVGEIRYSNSYGYIAVNATTIKRFPLSTF